MLRSWNEGPVLSFLQCNGNKQQNYACELIKLIPPFASQTSSKSNSAEVEIIRYQVLIPVTEVQVSLVKDRSIYCYSSINFQY